MNPKPLLRHALLVGVSRYDQPGMAALPGVDSDIAVLSRQLEDPGSTHYDSVTIVQGQAGYLKGQELREALETFLKEPAPEDARRLNLVWVGCHAMVDVVGNLLLLPSDFQLTLKAATSIPTSFIGNCLPYNPGVHTVIVLDCCFAGLGAWELFYRQPAAFRFPLRQEPAYCLMASCRPNEPAIDGAFTPLLVEALDRIEPAPGSRAPVGADVIFDYLAERLVDRHFQRPRLWQSRSVSIPIGRRKRGFQLSLDSVKELIAGLPGSRVESAPAGADGIDFLELQSSVVGHRMQTAFRVLDRGSTAAEVESAVRNLSTAVRRRNADKAVLLVEDEAAFGDLGDGDVVIHSFRSLRRARLPYFRFLEEEIRSYEQEKDGVYRRGCYIHLKARAQGEETKFILDHFLLKWASAVDGEAVLMILGEFGAGKTTTARRIFWHQAQAYLDSAATERLPIFVSLRELAKTFDLDTLIERIVHRQDGTGYLSTQRVHELNRDGRILWIFDGFDEMAARVSDRDLKRNLKEILKLASDASRLLLTCRTAYFKSQDELDHLLKGTELYQQLRSGCRSRIVYIDPLGAADIERYFFARDREDAGHSLQLLRSNPQIANLASRPLLLEMLVETLPLLQEEGLEPNYHNVYRLYTSHLLDRDDWRDTIETQRDRTKFCRELAWHLMTRGIVDIKYAELPAFIRDLFPENARKAEEFEKLDRSIRTTTFLARDEQAGTFSFAHKSFMEYFAADLLGQQLGEGKVDELGRMILSYEVVRFLGQSPELAEVEVGNLLEKAAAADGFSLAYFLKGYFPRRFLSLSLGRFASVSGSSMRHAAVLGSIFLLMVVLPIFLSFRDWPFAGVRFESFGAGQWLFYCGSAALVATFLFGLLQLTEYSRRVRAREEGNPVLRFNSRMVLAVALEQPLPQREDALIDLMSREERTIALRVLGGPQPPIEAAPASVPPAEIRPAERVLLPSLPSLGAWILGIHFANVIYAGIVDPLSSKVGDDRNWLMQFFGFLLSVLVLYFFVLRPNPKLRGGLSSFLIGLLSGLATYFLLLSVSWPFLNRYLAVSRRIF